METNAGEPLISTRPFAVTKWSSWLVSKESPCLSGSKPNYTNSATYLTATPAVLSLQRAHKQKTLGLQKPSVSNIVRRRNVQKYLVGSSTGDQ